MVLFLFVIMLLGTAVLPASTVLPWQKWLAGGLATILTVEAVYLLLVRARPTASVVQPEVAVNTMDNLREMGKVLFNQYLLPFEVTSILLLVAMVGAIVLTKKEKGVRG
jgi:NADH-quinone oxidoreductase subunit J